jgi:cytochrome c553
VIRTSAGQLVDLLPAIEAVGHDDRAGCGGADAKTTCEHPRLAAQHVPYLASQLELLRSRRRGGSPNVALMHVFVERLRSEQIRDVTRYYGSADVPSTPRVSTGTEQ